MDDVRFFGQDHASQTHAGTPKIIGCPSLPETKQAEDEQHREEHEPHLVNRVASIKNEPGRYRHCQCRHSTYGSPNEWLELECKPHATDAHEHNRQPQRPDISAKQGLREQQNVKMKRPVIIRRVVFIEPVFHHLVDKPAVDSFVEMRWLDAKEKKAQENGEPKNQPRRPTCFCKPRSPRVQLIAQHWKIC